MKTGWAFGAMLAGAMAVPAWVEAKPRMIPETQEIDGGGAEAGAPAEAPKDQKGCPDCGQPLGAAKGSLLHCQACDKTFDADAKPIACAKCREAAESDASCEACKLHWGAGRPYACDGCAKAAASSRKEGKPASCEGCNVSYQDGKKVEKAAPRAAPRRERLKPMPRIEGGGGAE